MITKRCWWPVKHAKTIVLAFLEWSFDRLSQILLFPPPPPPPPPPLLLLSVLLVLKIYGQQHWTWSQSFLVAFCLIHDFSVRVVVSFFWVFIRVSLSVLGALGRLFFRDLFHTCPHCLSSLLFIQNGVFLTYSFLCGWTTFCFLFYLQLMVLWWSFTYTPTPFHTHMHKRNGYWETVVLFLLV